LLQLGHNGFGRMVIQLPGEGRSESAVFLCTNHAQNISAFLNFQILV
jgi:hypothetical protein